MNRFNIVRLQSLNIVDSLVLNLVMVHSRLEHQLLEFLKLEVFGANAAPGVTILLERWGLGLAALLHLNSLVPGFLFRHHRILG